MLWERQAEAQQAAGLRTISVHDGKAACMAAARARLGDERALELRTPPGYRLEILDKDGRIFKVLTAQCWPVGVTPQ